MSEVYAPLITDPDKITIFYGHVSQACRDDGLVTAIISVGDEALIGVDKKVAKSLIKRLRSFIRDESLEPFGE